MQSISDELGGDFLVNLASMLVLMGLATASNAAALVVGSALGAIGGGLLGLTALALQGLNGFQLILKYLAVGALKKSVDKRLEFSRALMAEIAYVKSILINFKNINEAEKQKAANDLQISIQAIEMALIRLGIELQAEKRKANSNSGNIKDAINFLTDAQDALLGTPGTNFLKKPDFSANKVLLNTKAASPDSLRGAGKLTTESLIPYKVKDAFVDYINIFGWFAHSEEDKEETKRLRYAAKAKIVSYLTESGANAKISAIMASLFCGKNLISIGERVPTPKSLIKQAGNLVAGGTSGLNLFNSVVDADPVALLQPKVTKELETWGITIQDETFEYPSKTNIANTNGNVKLTESIVMSMELLI